MDEKLKFYEFEICPLELAKQARRLTGKKNPEELKEMQYWYNTNGDLIQIITLPDGHPEFGIVQVLEYRRAIIDVYARRDFERFEHAPMMLTIISTRK